MDIIKNAKARFDYEILDEFEAGIVLQGSEVKSLRLKKAQIADAFAKFLGHELYLVNFRIDPYEHGSHFNHDPARSRKLLLKKKELTRLKSKLAEKGWALIPLKLYFKDNKRVKVLLGLCRGKKTHDKRQTIKDRDLQREALRELKNFK